jgi:hypothetical protein
MRVFIWRIIFVVREGPVPPARILTSDRTQLEQSHGNCQACLNKVELTPIISERIGMETCGVSRDGKPGNRWAPSPGSRFWEETEANCG